MQDSRRMIAKLLDKEGVSTISQRSLDILVELHNNILLDYGSMARTIAFNSKKAGCDLEDVVSAIESTGERLSELREYVESEHMIYGKPGEQPPKNFTPTSIVLPPILPSWEELEQI